MIKNKKIAFIKGAINENLISRLKGYKLYSLTANKSFNIEEILIEQVKIEELKNTSINGIVHFYNRFDSKFIEFENRFGINPWFLEHFRMNFKFIHESKVEYAIKSFKKKFPNGEIIIEESKSNIFQVMKRFLSEILFIFRHGIYAPKLETKEIIIHNEGGTSFEASELFGKLTNDFKIFKIRSLFDLKRKLPLDELFDGHPNSDQIFIRQFFSFKAWKKVLVFRKEFFILLNELSINKLDVFETKILNHLKSKLIFFSVMYFRYLSFENLFKGSNVELFIISDENSPQQKVILNAARKTGVKSYAIQHGAIYKNHFAYTYGSYKTPPHLADFTFSWGEAYSKVLIEDGGYEKGKVKAVGSLRKKTRESSESNTTKKIILFATQPIPNEALRKKLLIDVYTSLKESIFDYTLIIRPHPNEKDDNYFIDLARQCSFSNFVVERDKSLEEHFEITDILITYYSTVGAEFVEYLKPIIVLDYLNEDLVGYIKEGIGIRVGNLNELSELLGKADLNINISNYNRFITNYFHSIDGKVEERIKSTLNLLKD